MGNEGSAKTIGFVFNVNSGPVLTIYTDGSVQLGKGFYPDQAGRMAAKALINYLEMYTKANPIFNPENATERIVEKITNVKDVDSLKKIILEELSKKPVST